MWLLIAAAILPFAAYGQGGIPLWTNRHSLNSNVNPYGAVMAVDKSGNVIVAGTIWYFESDYGVVAYSNAGAALWTNSFSSSGFHNDFVDAVAVDSNGNVFVTGSIARSAFDFDFATVAWSQTGVQLWVNFHGSPGWDEGKAIAVAPDGDVIVTGMYTNAGNGWDFATIAYSNSGTPLWTNRYGGAAGLDDRPAAIAVDKSGNIFVAGYSSGATSERDFATIKYSGTGVPLWTNLYNGPANGDDSATAIACDPSGNVIVTGGSTGVGSDLDLATIKYSSSGLPLWTNRYNGPGNGADWPAGVAVDDQGNVFVAGFGVIITNFGNDFLTIAYSAAGNPLWTNWYGGLGNDQALALGLDRAGNVFVAGYNDMTYGTVAYSNSGIPLWTNRFKSLPDNSQDGATALAVDADGNVFVAGFSSGDHGFDRATVKYSSSIVLPPHLDFAILRNQLVLKWTNSNFSLQSSPSPTSIFTNIASAAGLYTNSMAGSQQYFRLGRN